MTRLNNATIYSNNLIKSRIGERFRNNQGLEAIIIGVSERKGKNNGTLYLAKFIESGYVCEAEYGNIKRGRFKDYKSPSVYGVGISSPDAKKSPLYKTWSHMLERCYSKTCYGFRWYGGKGVKVCSDWLVFDKFEEDAKELINYNEFLEGIKKGTRNEFSLDKDILGDGLLYSKETCMFASQLKQTQTQKRVKGIIAIDSDGNEVYFPSVSSCSTKLKVPNANIYKVLNGERELASGYFFKRP